MSPSPSPKPSPPGRARLGDIETLIPHRPPMRLVDALIDCTEDTATATACFNADDFAVADGLILVTALVECVAQTVAAANGHRAQTQGRTSNIGAGGMLVAVSSFRVEARPSVGKPLRIEIRELKRYGAMLLVSGLVSCEGRVIASGELTLRL